MRRWIEIKWKERVKWEEEVELDIWKGRWCLSRGLGVQGRVFRNTVGSPILVPFFGDDLGPSSLVIACRLH